MNDKGIKYPDDFYDFRDGKQISNETIQKWIDECIQRLESSPSCPDSTYISSGNTKVIVFKDMGNDNKPCYEVSVASGHLEYIET